LRGFAAPPGEDPAKRLVTGVLTAVFIVLYVMAIVGYPWVPNTAAVNLLQPIVYVIIGYFFGRMRPRRRRSLWGPTLQDQQMEQVYCWLKPGWQSWRSKRAPG
jgi:drug/metabolite transporter (DMT)-like permease